MTIRGRYLQASRQASLQAATMYETAFQEEQFPAAASSEPGRHEIAGGIKVFFGGLELNLSEARGRGMILINDDGTQTAVNPDYMIIADNTARFILPGGTVVVLSSFEISRDKELQMSVNLAENISEIIIPVVPRRSSLIRENGNVGILYNNYRYFFGGQGKELENGRLTLSRTHSFVSYRSRGRQRIFNPSDYIIPQAQNYAAAISNWQDLSYAYWSQNASFLQSEDDIVSYCSEALRRGHFLTAVTSAQREFRNSTQHGFRSAGFIGGMDRAHSVFVETERNMQNMITGLTRERSLTVLREENIIDYLYTRGNIMLANDIIDIINNLSPESIIMDYTPGLLEAYLNIKQWYRGTNNPVEPLIEQILLIISENISRDTERNLVFAYPSEGNNLEFSLRLGMALNNWAQDAGDTEWTGIGRSLILSALTGAEPGAGRLYSKLRPFDYYPRAAWLADNGLWAWTVSPNATAAYTADGNLNISFSFPVNMTHYVMIRGVRPFIKLQIHNIDYRSAREFERYDSSGWVYYPQDQILVVKLRHRVPTETIRVYYRVDPPPVVQPPVIIEQNNADIETETNIAGDYAGT
jgi:hypothetical protein